MIGDELLDLACLTYSERDVAERYQRAQRRLEQDPSQSSGIFTAAAVGDAQAAETLLREDPTLVSTRGGPHAMEPLLYLCYARLHSPDPAHNPLQVAKLLLASGADPNVLFPSLRLHFHRADRRTGRGRTRPGQPATAPAERGACATAAGRRG